ncbi:MAG: site-2 protease family protein [Myxococcales bacterium]|nr:site-2 protease family protein [Polyangiaceae bacterium]MDW8251767.1 site-2 protease family protein [Myxococcales bacterium]
MSPEKIRLLALTLVTMILSLSVHEFAHAWAATRLGDDTPERDERLTLSPLAHIDPLGTILFPAISVLFGGVAFFGWAKPVQFNPNRFRRSISVRGGSAMVAAAGPLSNLLLAVLAMGLYVALSRLGVLGKSSGRSPTEAFSVFLLAMFSTNIGLCVFNFLPFPPLDGSYLLPRSLDDLVERIRPFSLLLLMILISIPAIRQTLLDWPMGLLRSAILSLFGVA